MSAMSQIREIIYEILDAEGLCTLEEVKKTAIARGVEISDESTVIRTTMYQTIKKDTRIRRKERGVYVLTEEKESDGESERQEDDCDVVVYINETEKRITDIVNELKQFNWFQGSDIDVVRARKIGISLKKFYEVFDKEIKELSL